MVKDNQKWALIIGGSQGLGLASARQLANDGFNLIIVHRDSRSQMDEIEANFKAIKSQGNALLTFNQNALKPDTITHIIEDVCRKKKIKIKVLLHSLAKGNLKALTGDNPLTAEDYRQTINAMGINFYEWAQAIVTAEIYGNQAQFLAFTSEGNTKVLKNYGAVSAAKAVLESIMRQMAVEFAHLGIRCNCIQAGVTETESLKRIPDADKILRFNQKRNPFQRLTTPEDVAKAVSLLCSEKANWINGCVIPVDGGERLK
jgi:enoyl-[acyl-carrier protein] reductase I